MTRSRARLAGALVVPVLLTACGSASSAASGLQEDAAAADAALAGATGLGISLRFDDPDGDLEQALQEGPHALPADMAEVVVGSRVDVRLAATNGRTLADQPDPDLPLADQLRWADSAFTVSTQGGDLLSWRTVDGVVYVSSDLDEVEHVAAAAGSPLSLRDEVAGAPAPLPQLHDELREGKALRVPLADLLPSLGALTGHDGGSAPLQGVPEGLLEDVRAAVEPHVRLSDLGSDDGVRRVTVEVDVERLLDAVGTTVSGSLPAEAGTLADEVDGLTGATVAGTLTIEDGHYRRLELPLAELVALEQEPTVQASDLGDSALVVELDDTVERVEAPTRVAELDLLELLGAAGGRPESSPDDDALLSCFEQAETEEELAACGGTA